ncbi:Flagellar hook-associated protein 3 [Aquicella siphonis]|uniref:Flagellar hook-associated protein 3 n=1 Tax=Aquicella siphonis TaxID=254247 RepID=A0A5E4PLB2_9COXI|nr:flagellar hook-associated protein FlgL [Aquicella siphonis]VVC77103.1 Flagellar hook-associated protein 3 [Aquicella siphonis]
MRIPTDSMFQQQLAILSQQYDSIARLMLQQEKGKKLLANSDDPVLASRIDMTYDFLNNIQAYSQNTIIGKNRSQLFDTSIQDAVNTVDQIKQIIQRAGSDTVSDNERAAMAEQLKGYMNVLLNDANTRDGNGEYIYSGYNTRTVPYILQGGTYYYQGGLGAIEINIGNNTSVLYSESGFKVFGDVLNGNGSFTIKAADTNTGTASSTPGTVTDKTSYVEDNYTISFVTNSAGKLAYQVTGSASGQVIPPPPATLPDDAPEYIPNSDISFNGMNIHMSGDPQVGDSFTAAPSQKENVFDGLQELISILQTPVENDPVKRAQFHQKLSQSSEYFANVYSHFVNYRSEVGTRMQVIQNQIKINDNIELNQQAIYDQLSNVKLEKVASDLSQQLVYLQATQDCYKLIQATFMQLLKGF